MVRLEMSDRLSAVLAVSTLALFLIPAAQVEVTADPPGPPKGLPPPVPFGGEGGVSIYYTGCGGQVVPAVNAGYEQQVVELVNQERAARGLPPLKRSVELDNAARFHATDMGQEDYYHHDTYDRVGGSLVWVCDTWTRIQSYYPAMGGENIAASNPTPQSAMEAWMNSAGHQYNILGTYAWEIGVGYYGGSGTWYHYWVQDFGRRSGVYPVIINGEAATVTSRDVSLYIYGDWSEVRFRNDDGSWSEWMPFRNAMNWTLGTGRGEHTVWVEMRKPGATASSSDTVYLDADPSLEGLPDGIEFTYSIPDQRLIPASRRVMPESGGSGDPLVWNVTHTGTWFTVSPLAGTTPNTFEIAPSTFATDAVATYHGSVTVTVVEPTGVGGSPHSIDLTLEVVNVSFHDVYLPLIPTGHRP
jgi:uncharacterized protein YkwD